MKIAYICASLRIEERSANTHALTAYVHNLIRGIFVSNPNNTVTILTSQSGRESKRTYTVSLNGHPHQTTFLVKHCFKRNILGMVSLFREIWKERYDIVHIQHETYGFGGQFDVVLAPFFFAALRLITTPIITLHHIVSPHIIDADFPEITHHPHIPPFIIRLGYKVLYKLTGSLAPTIIVHEQGFKDILIREYGMPSRKIHVVPHGVADPTHSVPRLNRKTLERMFSVPENTKRIFGYFGYILKYKNIEYLIEEFAQHIREHPHDVLLIVGNEVHPYRDKSRAYLSYLHTIKAYARELAGGRIIWFGQVNNSLIGHYFNLIDCLVLPYKICFGQSGPLSYAIGCEKPLLASEQLGILLPIPHLLFHLKKGALAAKLRSWNKTTAMEGVTKHVLAEMKRARQWDVTATKLLDLYANAMAHRTNAARKKIVIIGAYGQDNLGDELLLHQCLSFLPRESCIVGSSQPKRTEREHGVQTFHSNQNVFAQFLALLRAKVIVVGGGDQFKILKKTVWKPRFFLIERCFLLALFSKIFRKRLYFVGIGIGNISSPLARLLTHWSLRLATLTTFRERNDFEYCCKRVPSAKIMLTADLSFAGEDIQSKPRQTEPGEITLGVAPVFNIDDAESYQRVIRELGKALDWCFSHEQHMNGILLPFQTGYNPHDDIMTCKEILSSTTNRNRMYIARQLHWKSVDSVFGGIHFLWGMRLHSLILACMHHIPFIALIYDEKIRKFLEEIHYSSFGVELDATFSAEKLVALQASLVEDSRDIQAHLAHEANRLHLMAAGNRELLMSIAQEHAGDSSRSPHRSSPESTFAAVTFRGSVIQLPQSH